MRLVAFKIISFNTIPFSEKKVNVCFVFLDSTFTQIFFFFFFLKEKKQKTNFLICFYEPLYNNLIKGAFFLFNFLLKENKYKIFKKRILFKWSKKISLIFRFSERKRKIALLFFFFEKNTIETFFFKKI